MTKFLVECPVCEHREEITTEQINDKMTICTLCNHSFEVKPNRIQRKPEPTILQPEQVRKSPPPSAKPVQEKSPAKTNATPKLRPVTAEKPTSDVVIARSTQARAMLKRKRSPLVPILLGLAALASAAALVAVIIVVDPFRKPTKPAEDELALLDEQLAEAAEKEKGQEAKKSPDAAKNDSSSSVFRSDGESDSVELPPTNAPPDKPPKSPTYRIIRKTDVQKFWDNQFWHFVRLRVNTGDESHYVSGTIVDSRGWVATSLSAVANAKEIEIQSADSNLREFNGVRIKPTDLVRGVIKTDPGSDLVLLSINRQFVLSPTGVEFGKTDSLVASQHVIQCACPGTENWAWPRETQLEGRKEYDELDFDFQSQFEEQKLDQSNQFIMHSGYTDTAMGAALFSAEGKLLAINTGLSDQSSMILATPVEKLMALISSSEDKPMSLSILAR